VWKKIMMVCMALCFISNISYAASLQFREGDSGKDVQEIQSQLKAQGYYMGQIDGKFTHKVAQAVVAFQKKKKLEADGVIGPKTYLALFGRAFVDRQRVPERGINQSMSTAENITRIARTLIGIPYQWGGVTTNGFDCSGFVWYVFNKNSIQLPRTADVQYQEGKAVLRSQLRQGDLVFFSTDQTGDVSHIGIYTENDKFIHASSSRGIMESSLSDVYWKPRYLGARRIL